MSKTQMLQTVCVIMVGCCFWPGAAMAYSWHPVGPFAPAADLDFQLSSGQSHNDVAMAIDPVTGYPHIVYFSNSNHQWVGGRIFKVIYRYWNGSGWVTETIDDTLPQEIDDGEPKPLEGLTYTTWGVSIDLNRHEGATGPYTAGGIAYRYEHHYAYTPEVGEGESNRYTYVKYRSLTGNPNNGTMSLGTIEDVINPNPVDWMPHPHIACGTHGTASGSISVAHDDLGSPHVVFLVNVGWILPDGTWITPGWVCYRHKDGGYWAGSQWNDAAKSFTSPIYMTSGLPGPIAGVSMVMDKSSIPWVPNVAFSTVTSEPGVGRTGGVYFVTSPLVNSPDLIATVSDMDGDYTDQIRVSLAMDPTAPNGDMPCLAFDGDGVQYMEKDYYSGWTSPVVIRADNTQPSDNVTVRLGTLDIHPDTGRRWISTCDRELWESGDVHAYRRDGATWDAPLSAGTIADYWMPFLRIEREYGMPLITETGLTVFGVLGFPQENPSFLVTVKDSKEDTGISGAQVYVQPVAGGTETQPRSASGSTYRFWRMVPQPSTNSITFKIRATHPDYNPVAYGTYTVTANWAECAGTVTVYMTPLKGCGTPATHREETGATAWSAAFVPLLVAMAALVGWSLVCRRRKRTA